MFSAFRTLRRRRIGHSFRTQMSLEGQGGSAPSVSLRSVTKRFGDFTAVREMDLDIPQGPVLHDARPVRMRQDHDPAHDRRVRGAVRRHRPARRRGRDRPAALPAADEHGLPELRPVPAPERRAQRGVRPRTPARLEGRGAPAGGGGARARRPRARGEAQAAPAVRRAAAARRPRARARESAGRAAARRAAGRARPQAAQAAADRAQAHPAGRRASRSYTSRTTRRKR